jgi:hypothetical protein
MSTDAIPRRHYVNKLIPAERAIYDAIQIVEALGADIRLTDVVIRLSEAKDRLSDWADATGNVPPEAKQ